LTLIVQALGVTDSFFQANVLARKSVLVQLSTGIASAALKLICIWLGFGLFSFLSIYIIESLFVALGLLIAYEKLNFSFTSWKFNPVLSFSLLRDSWPLLLSGATAMISLRVDQVMIGSMLGSYSAGIYAVAVKLSEVWYFIPMIVISSLLPAIINGKQTSEQLYHSRYKKLYIAMILIPLFVAIFVSTTAGQIIQIIFGITYLSSASAFTIYIWSGIPIFLWYVLGQFLIIENHTRIHFFATTVGALTNVALNFILIPRLGIDGAAYATLFSYLLLILPMWPKFF
jgi:O-antigen/teichoic acid export membrane protein